MTLEWVHKNKPESAGQSPEPVPGFHSKRE